MNVTIKDPEIARVQRAIMGLANGRLKVCTIDNFHYRVESRCSSKKPQHYSVTLREGEWFCTCPDFERRQKPCKHIYAVSLVTRARI